MERVTVRGGEIPALGFGTARMTGENCERAVRSALEIGYRHLDTAQMYDNEEAVGNAIRDSDVDREEVFLTTKLHPDNLAPEEVHASFGASRDRLGVEGVDLLLIHSPSEDFPIEGTVNAMNTLQEEGRVNHIGVSNFSVEQLRTAMDASETPIATNQVEYHVRKRQDELLSFCLDEGVALTAYSPLDVGDLADEGALAEIADDRDKTPAQIALRWLVQQPNVAAVPKAASEAHRRENLAVFDFELSDEEMRRLFELTGGVPDRLRSALDP